MVGLVSQVGEGLTPAVNNCVHTRRGGYTNLSVAKELFYGWPDIVNEHLASEPAESVTTSYWKYAPILLGKSRQPGSTEVGLYRVRNSE